MFSSLINIILALTGLTGPPSIRLMKQNGCPI
jgi:hypothetical protein